MRDVALAEQNRYQFEWWALRLEEPTGPMKKEAATAGFYDPPGLLPAVAWVQILTIAELLAGGKLDYPRIDVATFKKAPRQRKEKRSH